MINPIDYETAQGMLQTQAAFTNRPYFINRRLDRTADSNTILPTSSLGSISILARVTVRYSIV